MQTVGNTYWERQSDNTEYKKTLRRPDPAGRLGSLHRSPKPIAGGEGLAAPPKNPTPLSALRASIASPTPTPKLVPTPLPTDGRQMFLELPYMCQCSETITFHGQ